MPEEQLKAFLEAVKADADLQEKLTAAADVDAVVEIANAAAFAISAEEQGQVEICDEELGGVTGGIRPSYAEIKEHTDSLVRQCNEAYEKKLRAETLEKEKQQRYDWYKPKDDQG
ncbi:Nif11-like leader peptide family natural product precursor [Synechococcus sp. CB0101]|uniref:Nif11-like leader peptide family RiPP precursor n=1 Tax=Synechococcus sp. CB0101 TaxID=232348 RepID=UPI0002001B89|nr:Nif11-like leader peptide family natural product precursor [Synechococcus sp. CB0101]